MLRTYRFRLYPNQTQRINIKKNVDACRFIYNWALETKQTAYKNDRTNLSWFDLNNRLKELKTTNPWLKEVYSQSLQQAIRRLHLAFKHFFRKVAQGEKRPTYPKYKSRKRHRQSFDVPQFFTIDFITRRMWLPKIGDVRTVFHRHFNGKPKTCTVISTSTGKFFISIVVDDGKSPPARQPTTSNNSIGVDVGLNVYATMSTGMKIKNPRHLQNSMKRLQCLHQRLSRKKKGSKNREKARQKLSRCYERIVNQRMDFQHKLSTRLISENQAIMVESLHIRGMMRNRRLSRHIADAAWSNFLRMLQYKAEWYGVTLIVVGQFQPTSKRCNVCGHINDSLTLSDRTWNCRDCGKFHDRDVNAAKNIKMMGLQSLTSPREPREELVDQSI